MTMLRLRCGACQRPWYATPLAPRSRCPFCGSRAVRDRTPPAGYESEDGTPYQQALKRLRDAA